MQKIAVTRRYGLRRASVFGRGFFLPLFTAGWFAKTEMYVLVVQPICSVRQNHRFFGTNDVIYQSFINLEYPKPLQHNLFYDSMC